MSSNAQFVKAVDEIVVLAQAVNKARAAADAKFGKDGIEDGPFWRDLKTAKEELAKKIAAGLDDTSKDDFDVEGLSVSLDYDDNTKPLRITAVRVRGWAKHPGTQPTYYSSSSSSSEV